MATLGLVADRWAEAEMMGASSTLAEAAGRKTR